LEKGQGGTVEGKIEFIRQSRKGSGGTEGQEKRLEPNLKSAKTNAEQGRDRTPYGKKKLGSTKKRARS